MQSLQLRSCFNYSKLVSKTKQQRQPPPPPPTKIQLTHNMRRPEIWQPPAVHISSSVDPSPPQKPHILNNKDSPPALPPPPPTQIQLTRNVKRPEIWQPPVRVSSSADPSLLPPPPPVKQFDNRSGKHVVHSCLITQSIQKMNHRDNSCHCNA